MYQKLNSVVGQLHFKKQGGVEVEQTNRKKRLDLKLPKIVGRDKGIEWN